MHAQQNLRFLERPLHRCILLLTGSLHVGTCIQIMPIMLLSIHVNIAFQTALELSKQIAGLGNPV